MNLEEYFNFLRPDDIRIKGTRIGIETILFDYIEKGWSPEAIAQTYPTLPRKGGSKEQNRYAYRVVSLDTVIVLLKVQYKSTLITQLQGGSETNIKPSYQDAGTIH